MQAVKKLCSKSLFHNRRVFNSVSTASIIRPEFDSQPSLLNLNTEMNANGSNNIDEILKFAKDKQEFFVGRLPLIGICEDRNSSYMQGAQNAPNLIRKAFLSSSGSFDQYYPESNTFINTETAMIDCGNLICDNNNISENHEDIVELLLELYNINATISRTEGYLPHPLITLGGDHSITYPVISGIKQSDPFIIGKNKIGVIHFDAHPDLYPPAVIEPDTRNPYSHASPFYNLLNTDTIDQLLQIGLRCMTKGQKSTIDNYGDKIQQLFMEQLFNDTNDKTYYQLIKERVYSWLKQCEQEGINNFYISIDIDVLEASFAPGISHYEPMGLSVKELFIAIDIIMRELYKNDRNMLIGCDIVEYNPLTDYNYMTAFVAARLLRRIVANSLSLTE